MVLKIRAIPARLAGKKLEENGFGISSRIITLSARESRVVNGGIAYEPFRWRL
jgi:hypothetical protein